MRTVGAAWAAVAVLSGCGSGHHTGPAPAASVTKRVTPGDAFSGSLVAAVAITKPGSDPIPVQVKFAVRQRPEVAQPLDIDIVIVPSTPTLNRVFGKVDGEEGIDVVEGELPGADKPAENVPIPHAIKVLPKHDGIHILTVTISADSAGQISTQAYSIPVIVGATTPDSPTPAASAGKAAPAPAKP